MELSKNEKANQLMEDAITKAQLKDFEGAIRDLDKAIAFVPNVPEMYWNRGACKASVGRHREAEDDFTKGINMKPDESHPYLDRAKVLTHNDDGIRFGKGARIKEAMKDFDTAIRLAPDDPDAWAERAFCKLESGQYPIEYALDDYEEALALDPKNLQATWGIAFVNYKKENYPAAYEGLKKVLSINPEVRRAYIYKASIEISIFKNFDAALEDCNTVIRLDPDFADAYFMRARANMELKHYRTVIKDLDTTIEKGATDITATLANRGTAKSELEDYDGAIADFTEAIKHKPTGQTYFNRGMAYGYNLKHDLAIADFNKAIALGYEPELALEWRAYSKLNAKDYAGAAVDFENIVKAKPQDAKALYNLGRAKYHSGDVDGALVYLHRANDAAPGTGYIKEYLDFVEEQKKK